MKKFFWLCGGYPSMAECDNIIDAYMKGGCNGIEWTIPPENPYREQKHLRERVLLARKNCPDYDRHLVQISNFKNKYPTSEVFPAIYEETVMAIGVKKITEFCKKNFIDTLFLIGTFKREVVKELEAGGVNTAIAVSYYLTEEEINKAKMGSGFIYMQAFPYKEEIDAGYTTDRLKECIDILRNEGIKLPIYCAKGIKKPEDIKIISDSGADGYILGSSLMDYYDDLDALTEVVKSFDEYNV